MWKLHFIESSNGTFFTIVFWGDLSTIIVSIASYMLSCFLVFMRNNKQLKQCNIKLAQRLSLHISRTMQFLQVYRFFSFYKQYNAANSNLVNSSPPVTWSRSDFPWPHFLRNSLLANSNPTGLNIFPPWEFEFAGFHCSGLSLVKKRGFTHH